MRAHRAYAILRPLPLAVAAVFGIGLVGNHQADPAAPFAELAYRSIRLFFLDLDAPPDAGVPWLLFLAAFLAPLLLAGGTLALVSERANEAWTRLTARGHVVVFGTDAFSMALARAALADEHRVVVVDDGATPGAAASLRRHGARTVRGRLADDESAWTARVDRASEIFIATDDDRANAAILRHVRSPGADVFVRLDDLERAKLIEHADAKSVTPFSVAELCARTELSRLPTGGVLLVVGQGPLTRALITDAAVRSRAARRSGRERPWQTVLLAGPSARTELSSLRPRLDEGVPGLRLDAFDVEIEGASTVHGPFRRYVSGWTPITRTVIVGDVVESPAGFALASAELLGDGCAVTLLRSEPDSFDEHVAARTRRDPHGATVDVVDVVGSLDLGAVRAAALPARLDRTSGASGGRPADEVVESLRALAIQPAVSEFVTFTRAERGLQRTLGVDVADQLEDAGVAMEWACGAALEAIVDRLLAQGQEAMSFTVCCELARRSVDADALERLARTFERRDAGDVTHRRAIRVLRLRCATLGHRTAHGSPAPARPKLRPPIVLIAGGAKSMSAEEVATLTEMLAFSFGDGSFDGTIVSGGTRPGACGVVGRIAREAGLHAVGFVWESLDRQDRHPGYAEHVTTGAECSIDQALGAWESIVAAHGRVADGRFSAGLDGDVRFLACSGGDITKQEAMLARALHVPVAWLPLRHGEPSLRTELLGEDVGIVSLVPDRATVRAFLRPSRWGGDEAERDRLARSLHGRYVERHRSRKPPTDPALASWSELSEGLRDSNRAVIDDLPGKLETLDAELERLQPSNRHRRLTLGSIDQPTIDLLRLAELEHGRYNAERLRAGWDHGVRNPSLQVTPYLKPWDVLDDEARRWDLEVVVDTVAALAEGGWAVVANGRSP